jgi:hypothetical protein
MTFRSFRRPVAHSASSAAEGALRKARWMIQTGRFAQAGLILAEQAREAEAFGRARMAGELHSRAAFCLVESSVEPAGLGEAQAALRVWSDQGSLERYARFFFNITAKLRARGMLNAVGTLQTEFGGLLAAQPVVPRPAPTLRLPKACPQCSAPMLDAEVEWIDAHSAECAYCGAVVQPKNA